MSAPRSRYQIFFGSLTIPSSHTWLNPRHGKTWSVCP